MAELEKMQLIYDDTEKGIIIATGRHYSLSMVEEKKIILQSENGMPLSYEPYQIIDASGKVISEGKLNKKGKALISCKEGEKLVFPNLPAESLKKTDSVET